MLVSKNLRIRFATREDRMSKRFIVTVVCSALGLISASGFALAETVGGMNAALSAR